MRTAVLAILIFFSLAPTALAVGATGSWDTTPATGGAPVQTNGAGNIQVQTNGAGNNANTGTNVMLINPLQGGGNLETFLLNILDFVIRIGTIVVILMMVYVGFLFVKAQGVPGEITKARDALLWTLVGALVLLGSKAIALAIEATVKALSGTSTG